MALRSTLHTPSWLKYGLLGGFVALSLVALAATQSGDRYSLGAVLVGGAVAGYLFPGHRKARQRVGLLAGLVGGLPLVWVFRDVLLAVVEIPNPLWFRALSLLLLTSFVATLLGLFAVVGLFGARLGDWLADKTGRRRPRASSR
jgi:uncharacterized membrane protein YeaQ/YmgE (transglycosylase-associated protein family)